MAFITSTMTSPIVYTVYKLLPGGMKTPAAEVLIKGGANAVDKKTLVTPEGVSTEVTDEELALLKAHPLFKEHLSRGFVKIVETKYREEAEKAVKDLEKKDGSAPKTLKDYKNKKVEVK